MLHSVPPWPILPLLSSLLISDIIEGRTSALPFVVACILQFPHPKRIRLAGELLSKWFHGTTVHFLSFMNKFFIITLNWYVNRTVFQINLRNTLQDYKKPTFKEALNWILTAVVWVGAGIALYPFFLPKNQLLEQWGGMVYVKLVNKPDLVLLFLTNVSEVELHRSWKRVQA